MPVATPFGRYELYDRVAVGGMAELFLARARGEGGFQKTCVIKRVLPHLAQRADFIRMFLDEARIVATLNHPGIVQIFELGKVDDSYFIAMEYLAGEDLSTANRVCVERGERLPLRIAVHVVARAAEALHHAHQATGPAGEALNIVHRDVSPSNILVTYQGVVKVVDFGIAHAEQRLQQTDAGTVKGKANYMSPEQSRGQSVDRRSDVWALGVCLHELLTGRRLFEAESLLQTSLRVLELPIPAPSTERPGVSAALDAVILRCLERSVDRRTADAETLRAELDAVLLELGGPVTPAEVAQWLRQLFGDSRAEGRARPLLALAPNPTDALEASTDADAARATVLAAPQERRLPVGATLALAGILAAVTTIAVLRPWSEDPMVPQPAPVETLAAASVDSAPPVVEPTAVGRPQTAASATSERSPSASALTPPDAASPIVAGVAPALNGTDPDTRSDAVDALASDVTSSPAAPERGTASGPPSTDKSSRAPVAATAGPSKTPTPLTSRKRMTKSGRLSLRANVPVVAYLGRRRLGQLPLADVEVPAGDVALRLTNRALGISRTVRLSIPRGGTAQEQVVFGQGTLNVLVDPWADVFVDGERVGQTPLAGRVLWEGRHKVRLENPEGKKELTVTIEPGQTVVIRESLP